MDCDKTKAFIDRVWSESVVQRISDYIRIENQSPHFDPEWSTNGYQEQAVELLTSWVREQHVPDLHLEVIHVAGRTPLVFIEVPSTRAGDNDTVLLYGHLDKQPPLTDQWAAGLHPYTPVLRDGKLYGRGGADDGYAIFSAVTAIKALKEQGLAHSRCVVIIEACEESGSFDLPFYIEMLSERIGTPSLVVCLDSGCGNYEQFWLTSSLRGLVVGTLNVEVLTEACHSGKASGIVPSSFRIIRQLLSRLEDENTGAIVADGFQAEIPPERRQQAQQVADVLGREIVAEFPFVGSAAPPADLPLVELVLNRTWRPALSYTGVGGIPSLASAGNVLRTNTQLKLSLRLPPNVEAKAAAQKLKELLERDPPYNARVTFDIEKAGTGWASPPLAEWLDTAVTRASTEAFGKPPLATGEGGSIPFIYMLGVRYPAAQFVITGVLGPHSNAHGPNEFLELNMSKNVTYCTAYILHAHAHRAAQQ